MPLGAANQNVFVVPGKGGTQRMWREVAVVIQLFSRCGEGDYLRVAEEHLQIHTIESSTVWSKL